MKRDEALRILMELIDEQPTSMEYEAVLATLSAPCPICGGREPLAAFDGWIPQVGSAEEGAAPCFFGAKPLDRPVCPVYVLVFADKPYEERSHD